MFRSLSKLFPYLRPFVGLLLLSGLLAIPLAALRFSPAPLVKYLVDDLLVSKNSSKLLLFPALFIGIYLVNFVVRFLHYYTLRIVIARAGQRIKYTLYNHLLGLSADHFTSQSTGSLISRVATDPQHIDGGFSCINIILREPVTFAFLFAYACTLNWKLTLITVAIFPLLAWVFAVTGRNLKRYVSKMSEENARFYSDLQESFSGIRVIHAFHLQAYMKKKVREKLDRFTKIVLKSAAMEEAAHPMVELLTAFAVAAVIYYGGAQVLSGAMTSGDLLAFFTAFALMMDPIRKLNEVNIKLNHAAGAADRVNEVLQWKSRLTAPVHPLRKKDFSTSVRFESVEFAYPDAPDRPILRGLSFEVRKGQVVALVGESGAGKSSIASLLPRVFDVTSGKIAIDGQDIRAIELDDLRHLMAVVSQDVFLFNDTVSENIRCGRLQATEEEVREAARKAHALEFIETLPNGFATIVGDRGLKLSGGERQRISIARAFLRQAPILILDEATSSLDSASEKAVQSALDELMQNRTTLVIAHRLSTVQHADTILVLKKGQIVESGRHDELLRNNGEYVRFQRLQSGALS